MAEDRADADVTRPYRRWTDEDAAYAAAQWASGIPQRAIAKAFGYANSAPICSRIAEFIAKYTYGAPGPVGLQLWEWQQRHDVFDRRELVKDAIERFVDFRSHREARDGLAP